MFSLNQFLDQIPDQIEGVLKVGKRTAQVHGVLSGFSLLLTILLTLTGSADAKSLQLLRSTVDFSKSPEAANLLAISSEQPSNENANQKKSIFVIQFKTKITESIKKNLVDLGFEILRYVPQDSLMVRGSQASFRAKNNSKLLAQLEGAIVLPWSEKLGLDTPTLSVFSGGTRGIYTVQLFKNSDLPEFDQLVKKFHSDDFKFLSRDGKYLLIRVRESLLPQLAQSPQVEFVEPQHIYEPMIAKLLDEASTNMKLHSPKLPEDTGSEFANLDGFESGVKITGFEKAWSEGYFGEGQSVGVADTGLDSGNATGISGDFSSAVTKGFHYGWGATDWSDPMGHGTHVAGSVGGRGSLSNNKITGGATKAQIIPEGMWSKTMSNLTVPTKLATLFDDAYSDGARIHTNSWGSPANLGAYDAKSQQVDEYLWNHPDMIILFAAGNSGVDADKNGVIDLGSVGSPGTAKNTLTVGASENLTATGGIQKKVSELKPAAKMWPAEPIWSSKISDNPNGIAMFSARGPTRDGRLKPEVVAPGTNILSARSHAQGANDLWGRFNADYVWSGGTSMSTPLVAGAAAVVREYLIKKYSIENPSGALVKGFLMHTAKDLYPGQYGEGTPTQELQHRPEPNQGFGRVDLTNAFDRTAAVVLDHPGVAQGQAFEKSVEVSEGQKLIATLNYTDAPGSPSVAKALVNDLDLVVLDQNGKETSLSDRTNNYEMIEMKGLSAGTYKVMVRGVNVPMGKEGKQPFSLLVTLE